MATGRHTLQSNNPRRSSHESTFPISSAMGSKLSAHQTRLLEILNGASMATPEKVQHLNFSDTPAASHIPVSTSWPWEIGVPNVNLTAGHAAVLDLMEFDDPLPFFSTPTAHSPAFHRDLQAENASPSSSEGPLTPPAAAIVPACAGLACSDHRAGQMRLDVRKLRTSRLSSSVLFDPLDEVVPFLPRHHKPSIVPIGGGKGYVAA